jgi:hypothetical protein
MIIVISSCTPCLDGHGEIISEVREVDDFTKIEVDVPADVYIHIGEFYKVSVQTHSDLIGLITTEVRGNSLRIDADPCIGSVDKFRIDVVVKKLTDIDLNGSCRLKTSKSVIRAEDFSININGSSELMIDLQSEYVRAKINGSGGIYLKGKAHELKLKINGSGDFNGFNFQTSDASIKINGSGDAKIIASDRLDAEISGSGDVKYKGEPRKLKTKVNGSGSVVKVD